MEAMLDSGIAFHSDYSGRLCAEAGFLLAGEGMRMAGGRLQKDWFVKWGACDINSLCQRLIAESTPPPEHSFRDLLSTLPDWAVEAVKELRPTLGASDEEAKACYDRQAEYLDANRNKLFSPKRRCSACLLHPGRQCHVQWQHSPEVPSDARPLTWNVSGAMCTPWTPFGARRGLADPATEAWHIWSTAMSLSGHDLITLENSHAIDMQLFPSAISKGPHSYTFVPLIFSVDEIGFPNARRRSWHTAIKDESVVWVGPRTPEAIREAFLGFFGCTVRLEADDFLVDSPEAEQEVRRDIARTRGVFSSRTEGQLPITALLCNTALQRFNAYKQIYEEDAQDRIGLAGTFVADISQDPTARRRCGSWLPACTRSSQFYSFSRGRFLTPLEVDVSQGWPLSTDGPYGDVLPVQSTRLTLSQQRSVSGNGMHLAQVGAAMAFVMAHCIKREVLLRMLPPVRWPGVVVVDLDDADEDDV